MPRTPFYTKPGCFYSTYKLYRDYVGIKGNISYSRWSRLPEKLQAAALYVQFYNEITLAWKKTKTDWAIEDASVEEINRVLMKNVPIILDDKDRYSPNYIYKVCHNALYCINIDPKTSWRIYHNEVSESFDVGDGAEWSWFDVIGESHDMDKEIAFEDFQEFLDSLDAHYQAYIEYELGELSITKTCSKLKKLGKISGKLNNPMYKALVMEVLCDEYREDLAKKLDERFDPEELLFMSS